MAKLSTQMDLSKVVRPGTPLSELLQKSLREARSEPREPEARRSRSSGGAYKPRARADGKRSTA
ncbi:MAG TPA: hypothetical protein VK707_04045 [Solirubrobacteraceae bacterium]|nr:hypothetical protein [Solirubrobacteraceae bacterium]